MAQLESLKPSVGGKLGYLQFTDDPNKTLYLMDTESKAILPFTNETAIFNYFGELLKDLVPAPAQIDSEQVATQGGALYDYKVVPNSQGVQIDGKIPKVSNWDASQMSIHYGKPKDLVGNIETFEKFIGKQGQPGLLDYLQNMEGSQLKSGTIEDIKRDKNKLGFYMNADRYGNYSVPDIYRSILKNQMIAEGSTELEDIMVINPYKAFEDYKDTQDYKRATEATSLSLPEPISGIDWAVPLSQLPDEVWETITPPLDINSPEFKAEMDKVKSAYYDVLMANMEATTDQEKAVADYQWEQLKDFTEKKYGLQLSANAVDAWGQIQSIGQTAGQRGLLGTGIEAEAIAKQLEATRKADDLLREGKVTEEEANEINNLLKSGTDEEINAYLKTLESKPLTTDFTQADKDEIMGMFKFDEAFIKQNSLEELKKKYPNEPEHILNLMAESVISPTGNRRSQLYQNQYKQQMVDLETGRGALADKYSYQQAQVQAGALRDEEKGSADFTPGERFEGAPITPETQPQITTTPTGTTDKFRPRGDETLSAYLTAKQAYETEKTGSSTITFGKPPEEKLPVVDPNIAAKNKAAQEAAANLSTTTSSTQPAPTYKPTDMVTLAHPTSGTMQSTYKDYEDWWKKPSAGSWTLNK